MSKRKCLYCDQEKDFTEYSLEHIFPNAIGGSIFSDTFKTRNVCRKCNSLSGLFIDGPFIKNFFSQNDRARSYLNYIDFNKPVALPLTYMGALKDFPGGKEDKVCEVWFGPHGGIVYHVRQKADSRYDTMIGGNPIENKKDNGWITIFAQNADLYWNAVLLLSCEKYFDKARRISGGIHLTPQEEHDLYFNKPTDEELNAIQFFKSIQGKYHHLDITVQVGFEQRFLAKLALGIGYNLFGTKFLEIEYSRKLRNALWEKDLKKREQIIDFSNYFSSDDNLKLILTWEGVHTLILYPIKNILHLIFYCFGSKRLMVALCDRREIWENTISPNGVVYVAAPQLEFFLGPLDMPEFIAHRIGQNKIVELEEIDMRKFDVSQLRKITDYS